MSLTVADYIARHVPLEIKALVDLMRLFAEDRVRYEEIANTIPPSLRPAGDDLVKKGFFRRQDLIQMMHALKPGGIGSSIVDHLIRNAVNCNLVNEIGPGMAVEYLFAESRVKEFIEADLVDAILVGHPLFIVNKFRKSVVAVIVRKDNDEFQGSSFIFRLLNRSFFLVTARHNVDDRAGVEFLRCEDDSGNELRLSSPWFLSDKADIAVARIESPNDGIACASCHSDADVLTETITLGYPRIPHVARNPITAHRGELNAICSTYNPPGDILLISNAVSPGSSGGPVFNKFGVLLGVVVRSLEAEFIDGGVAKFQAAVPARDAIRAVVELANQGG